jgi:glycosyltransferase involved in cell wall biosynthesis
LNDLRVLTLIPTFNSIATLEEAIVSALKQDDIIQSKVLVCDDASTDQTSQLLELLSLRYPERLAWITNSQNIRAGASRNRLINFVRNELGRGFLEDYRSDDYLAFLDADDICLPSRFRHQVEHLQRSPACRMVGGQLIAFGHRPTEEILAFPGDADEIRVQSLFETVNLPSTYFCRIDTIFHNDFYFSNLPYGEDWEFFIRNHLWLNYENLEHPVCRYRRHASNTTANISDSVDSIGTRLRLSYLMNALDIDPSSDEIKLHITISPCKFWRTEEQGHFWKIREHIFEDANRWLKRLGNANQKQQFVSPDAFESVASRILNGLKESLSAPKPVRFLFELS